MTLVRRKRSGEPWETASEGDGDSQLFVNLAIGTPEFGPGADVPLPFTAGTFPFRGIESTAFTGPETVGVGQTLDPFIDGPSVALPAGASLEIESAYFVVSNAAGTQKLRIQTDQAVPVIAPCTSYLQSTYLPVASVSVEEQIGSDLSIHNYSGNAAIKSAAGGQFFAELWVRLAYTPPA